jgi:hypothetical protein
VSDLGDQIDADLAEVFFAEGGIGVVPAIYRSADGTELREILGVLDREHAAVPGEFADTAGRRTTFATRESYWPETFHPEVGGTLEIDLDPLTTTTFTIRAAEPDGTGVVVLVLEGP